MRASVNELMLAFLRHAEQHYRRADGSPTHEVDEYRLVIRYVREMYGEMLAALFTPVALKAVRSKFIAVGWCRSLINQRVNRVRRMFKWAVSESLLSVTVYQALATVTGLQKVRSQVRESDPVTPVDDDTVDATLPHLNRHVRGLVEFQRYTGCRPGEACAVRMCDIDTTGPVWLYRPAQHKTAHHGKARVIAVGPQAQEVLRGFATGDPADYLFDPGKATAEHHTARGAARKTPKYASHMARNTNKRTAAPKRKPAAKYTVTAYGRAIARACDRAKVEHWHPNRLRHSFATAVRKAHGLEAAQVLLGHSRADVTQVYAERDATLAAAVAAKIG